MTTPQQCPRCGGKGEATRYSGGMAALVNCSYCGGTGQLAAKRDEGAKYPPRTQAVLDDMEALREECVALRVVAMAAQGTLDWYDKGSSSEDDYATRLQLFDELRDALAALHKPTKP